MIEMNGLIQILTAFCGTLGFGFLFNSRGKKLFFSAFGGMLAWLLFLLLETVTPNEVFRYFLVSFIITIDQYIYFYNNERIQLKTGKTPLEKRRLVE